MTTLIALLWLSIASASVDLSRVPEDVLEHYYKEYPYMKYRGQIWSAESEFTWPEGYRRLDSAALTPFQNWVSYMPLWHHATGVTASRSDLYKPHQISRAVHLPWRTSKFADCVIPLQVLAEYLLARDLVDSWHVLPKGGDTITYQKYLASEVVYDGFGRISFRPGMRIADSTEFDRFFDLIALNTSYGSLAANADSIPDADLRPGDLLITRNEVGTRGRVHMILVVIANDAGERRYLVATGCPNRGCDFHIPLYHDNRKDPWLTLDEVRALAPEDVAHVGFFRLRVPQ